MALNKVLLIGNVGKDPEVRHLESGASIASFSLATTERFRDRNSGESKESTEWHNIVAWRQLADLAENYIRKGMQIYVEGRIHNRSWDDQSGVKHYVTEIVADTIQLLGRRGDNPDAAAAPAAAPAPRPAQRPAAAPARATTPLITPENLNADSGEDDLPF